MSLENRATAALYQTLQLAYSHFNKKLFNDQLPDVMFTVTRQPNVCGYVSYKRWLKADGALVDELGINPAYFASYPSTIAQCKRRIGLDGLHYVSASCVGGVMCLDHPDR